MEQPSTNSEREQEPLEVIKDYLIALQSDSISEYERVRGVTNNVLFDNSGLSTTGEAGTSYVIRSAKLFEKEGTPERFKLLKRRKTFAAVHVVSGMIEGDQIPISEFEPVIDQVKNTISWINRPISNRHTNQIIKKEIRHSWRNGLRFSDPEKMLRAAEAYKYVGRPFVFGVLSAKVAALKSRDS